MRGGISYQKSVDELNNIRHNTISCRIDYTLQGNSDTKIIHMSEGKLITLRKGEACHEENSTVGDNDSHGINHGEWVLSVGD